MESSLGVFLDDWSLENDAIDLHSDTNSENVKHNECFDVKNTENQQSPIEQFTTEMNATSENGMEQPQLNMPHLSDDINDGSVAEDDELSVTESLEVNPFDGLPYSSMYHRLLQKRRRLPVWQAKDDFVLAVEESSIVLVTGKAGSGKSTQIPQWCVQLARESNFQCGTVVCSQPSAHAAMSLAIQISQEMDFTEVGNEIGYKIPQADCSCQNTILTFKSFQRPISLQTIFNRFCTDEILLREMADDPLLQKYNYVIIDEAQERTVATDILLALLKSAEITCDELKVVIICLSSEMEKLEDFFEEVPVIDLYFLEEESIQSNGERAAIDNCAVGEITQNIKSVNVVTEPAAAAALLAKSLDEDKFEEKRRKKVEEERMKQLKIRYHPTDSSSLVKPVADLVVKLHCDETIQGNFLVFLPTSQEIEEVCELMVREVAIKAIRGEVGDISVIPLHPCLPYRRQQVVCDGTSDVFDHICPSNKRLVVVSNEIAESMFSTENINVVIDTGVKEEEIFNCRTRTKSRLRKYISFNSANLRSSRCLPGGQLYRLYDNREYETMKLNSIPAIKRVELTPYILLLKRLLQRLNISFSGCQFIDPPDPEAYMLALEELDYHGGLDENGNLSDLGAVMSEFPLNLQQAKCIIASCGEDCVQEMLTIIAMMTSPTCWSVPLGFEKDAEIIQQEMTHKGGDHFTFLNIFRCFLKHKRSEVWCLKNYISFEAMKTAEKKRADLMGVVERLELPISEQIEAPSLIESSVKRALLAGFFMQIARDTDGCGNYLILRDKHIARLKPRSFFAQMHEWILYNEFHLTQSSHVTVVSHVRPQWVAEISPHSYLTNLPSSETKTLLLKLSARWRKQLVQDQKLEVNDKNESTSDLQLQRRLEKQRQNAEVKTTTSSSLNNYSSKIKIGESSSNTIDLDDADVITQAAHSMTEAYQQAANYVSNIESGTEEDQCVVQ